MKSLQTPALDVAGIVFAELARIFGHAFTIEHGADPDARWRAAIGRLTVAELEHGLRAVASRPEDRPNCSAFIAACRGDRFAVRTIGAALPARLPTVDRHLAAIRSRLVSE